ncbi:transcriptional regulator PadR family protein [Halovivax asiaticus JCM 14624]|uniref:Transcriptional regulator PadR family protein n=1 Tax=Halovivax asiaticus JCM 14624 TaxID=1227490 RepID=M0BRT5_9EURY|nr:PadR family transcriptional regulator [Halovivax asiaticus]ELZ13645.1 transcriptional regulator PadR family protein [Halovivax asiaticus JCM 14624]
MSRWLQSGRRRDICYLLAGSEERRGQQVKSALESHYEQRIDPSGFYGSLSALVDAGFVEKRTDGLHDVYTLTDAGQDRLDEHVSWLTEQTA